MDILTICLCILVLAGVFALVSLGVFLIHALTTLKDVSHLAQHLETTVSKVNDKNNSHCLAHTGQWLQKYNKSAI